MTLNVLPHSPPPLHRLPFSYNTAAFTTRATRFLYALFTSRGNTPLAPTTALRCCARFAPGMVRCCTHHILPYLRTTTRLYACSGHFLPPATLTLPRRLPHHTTCPAPPALHAPLHANAGTTLRTNALIPPALDAGSHAAVLWTLCVHRVHDVIDSVRVTHAPVLRRAQTRLFSHGTGCCLPRCFSLRDVRFYIPRYLPCACIHRMILLLRARPGSVCRIHRAFRTAVTAAHCAVLPDGLDVLPCGFVDYGTTHTAGLPALPRLHCCRLHGSFPTAVPRSRFFSTLRHY